MKRGAARVSYQNMGLFCAVLGLELEIDSNQGNTCLENPKKLKIEHFTTSPQAVVKFIRVLL